MNNPHLPFKRFTGYIVAVYVDGAIADTTSQAVRARAITITYDAAFVTDHISVTLPGITPYNRSFENAGIISAKQGDMCDVTIDDTTSQARVYVHTEKDDLHGCDKQPIESL
jgi:hypothetical protein